MSRHTENKEEILKIHGCIDLINQRIDTIENNHLKHIQSSIAKNTMDYDCCRFRSFSTGISISY